MRQSAARGAAPERVGHLCLGRSDPGGRGRGGARSLNALGATSTPIGREGVS